MKIYTKFGDRGETVLFDGTRVTKSHLRIETYGTLDELNSHLGVALTDCQHPALQGLLTELQQELFVVGSDLATPVGSKNEAKVQRLRGEAVGRLEGHIDAATAQLPPLKSFILPGGGLTAARLHVARTVCRRAERLLTSLALAEAGGAGEAALRVPLIYLNRLSDLLFTLARLANQLDGVADVQWQSKKPG